jgi:segregation and condensation protein B
VVRTLLDRKLITITGRADGPGRPLLYSTTKEFLRYFGVNELTDLPKPREIEDILKDDNVLPDDMAESVDLTQLDLSKIAKGTTDSGEEQKQGDKPEDKPEDSSDKPSPKPQTENGKDSRADHAAE